MGRRLENGLRGKSRSAINEGRSRRDEPNGLIVFLGHIVLKSSPQLYFLYAYDNIVKLISIAIYKFVYDTTEVGRFTDKSTYRRELKHVQEVP